MCSAPISKKPEIGGLRWVFMVPPGYKLDSDIAAVLSSYKEFGSQIACPKFTTTTTCKKPAHQKLTDPERSVHCAGGAKPWHGPFVVMQGEFGAISYWQIKSFCGVSKRCSEARLFRPCKRAAEMTRKKTRKNCLFNTFAIPIAHYVARQVTEVT